jgi:ABC-type transport system involved in multi-copper enzyme maturation permease subunit
MITFMRTELRKLTTTPAFLLATTITVALAIISTTTNVLLAGKPGLAPLGTVANVDKTLSVGSLSSMVMLVLGIFSVGGEYRHRTIVTTFLVSPRRGRVIVAKAATLGLLGALVGAVTFGVSLATAIPLFATRGVHHLGVDLTAMWLGATLSTACFALVGVAIGALTRNTVTAVLASLAWLVIIEQSILQPAVPALAKWLPASAAIAITNSTTSHGLLSMPIGAAVLTCYAIGLSALATTLVARSDVR